MSKANPQSSQNPSGLEATLRSPAAPLDRADLRGRALAPGEPFYSMKLVSGRSFAEVIAEARTLDQRLALLPHAPAVSRNAFRSSPSCASTLR